MKHTDSFIGCACALSCETFFGLSYVFTKQMTENVGTLSLLGWRFFVAGIVMLLCAATGVIRIDLHGTPLRSLLQIALVCPVLYFSCETVGISLTTASESGAFLACIPIASLGLSAFMLGQRPGKWQITGIATTLVGVLITVIAAGVSASFSLPGYGVLCVCVLSYALYSVLVEKAAVDGGTVTFFMMLVGTLCFTTAAIVQAAFRGTMGALAMLPFTDHGFAVGMLFQSLGCSVLAFFLSNIAISKIGVNRTASFIGVSTVVSIIVGILLLGEQFSVGQMIGAVVIVAGVYIANFAGAKE